MTQSDPYPRTSSATPSHQYRSPRSRRHQHCTDTSVLEWLPCGSPQPRPLLHCTSISAFSTEHQYQHILSPSSTGRCSTRKSRVSTGHRSTRKTWVSTGHWHTSISCVSAGPVLHCSTSAGQYRTARRKGVGQWYLCMRSKRSMYTRCGERFRKVRSCTHENGEPWLEHSTHVSTGPGRSIAHVSTWQEHSIRPSTGHGVPGG
eukprot:622690-Rhodomonas_salina.2